MAWASRAVGGKYRVSRRESSDGVWFEVEHLVNHTGASPRYAGGWDNKPVKHQPIARNWCGSHCGGRGRQRPAQSDQRARRSVSQPASLAHAGGANSEASKAKRAIT